MTKMWFRFILSTFIFSIVTLSHSASEPLSKALNPSVSVSGHMTATKFNALMQQGFKSVIVNRPDQESGNETTASELRALAEKSKISLIYQPVISGQITGADVHEFAKYYNSLPKPILLVCKSGSRSTLLFNKANSLGLIHE